MKTFDTYLGLSEEEVYYLNNLLHDIQDDCTEYISLIEKLDYEVKSLENN